MTPGLKYQPHGIKAQQTTITLSGDEMTKVRREARSQGISVSLHIANLIRLAWSVQGALSNLPSQEADKEAVAV